MAARHPIRIGRYLVRGGAIAVLGFVAAFASVAAAPGVAAAPVACSASSLVTALAAVSGSGQSGTVTLTAGCTYTMTAVNNTADGSNAFPDILGSVTIVGNGATITRSGSTEFRFFVVDDGGSLDISNLTLSNGSIPSGETHGGGAILNRDHLTVSGVTFQNNHSTSSVSTGGGAIDNHDRGVLSVDRSTFSGNVGLQGGAIEDEATLCHTSGLCGSATVTNSTFINNSTTQYGGGGFESQLDGPTPAPCVGSPPYLAECQAPGGANDTLVGDTFSGNTSVTEGGGIASFGTMTVTNSTITGNSTGSGGGGGVQNTGALTITLSTIAGNSTTGSPSGSDIHSFTDTTHQPGTTALSMSIVSGGNVANCGGTNAMTDNGYNLDSGTSCGFSNHALTSTDPTLGSLASNGGPTQTMALQGGSPAIDIIPSGFSGCSGSTDQRGVSRPQNGSCDIGAFEVDTTLPTVPTGLTATATAAPGVNLSWNASTDNLAVTGYTIYRNGSTLTTVSGTTLSYSDLAVTQTTTYTYKVDAFDAAGNHSAKSVSASATTPDITPPSVPTGLNATPVVGQVNVSWSASTDNVGVTGYTVYRNGSQLTTVSGSTLTYADTSAVGGNMYTYTVDAFDAAGNHSAQSAPVSVNVAQVSYFNWFDLASPGMVADNIHLLNTSGSTAHVNVSMPGATPINVSLAAHNETYVSFGHGHIGGPVVVSSDQQILASQRVQYYQSFNEVWSMSAAQANTTLYIPWFDRATAGMVGDNIHVLNPGGTSANVVVSLPGHPSINFPLAAGSETYVSFPPGTIGGPVKITSTVPVLGAQRVQYYKSFNEEVARPASDGQKTSYFNWFDRATAGMVGDNIHILNPGATTANVRVKLAGASDIVFPLVAGGTTYVSFGPGHIGGPVTVISDLPVLATQRVQYFQSFNEVPQAAAAQAMNVSHIMWFDRASAGMVGDNIHVLNTSVSAATVTVSMPGATNIVFALPVGAETYVSFGPGHLGGPVTISSTQPVLAAQRVQYFQSFNEVAAN